MTVIGRGPSLGVVINDRDPRVRVLGPHDSLRIDWGEVEYVPASQLAGAVEARDELRAMREQNRKHHIWHGELQARIAELEAEATTTQGAVEAADKMASRFRAFMVQTGYGSPEQEEYVREAIRAYDRLRGR